MVTWILYSHRLRKSWTEIQPADIARWQWDQSEFWSWAEKLYLMQSNFICSWEILFDAEQFYLQQRNFIWCRVILFAVEKLIWHKAILFAADKLYLLQRSFICRREFLFDAEKHYSQQETLFSFPAFWATVPIAIYDERIIENILCNAMSKV